MAVPQRRLVWVRRPVELAVLRGEDRAELRASIGALGRFLSADPDVPLAAVAEALHRECDPAGRARLSIVAANTADLKQRLGRAEERLRDPACTAIADPTGTWYAETSPVESDGIAAMYPGEGSQYEGMLADLALGFDVVREVFDLATRALPSWADGSRPDSASAEPAQDTMQKAIAAVIAGDLAVHALMESLAFRPDAIVGHSAGEFAALLASGATPVRANHELLGWMTEGLNLAQVVEEDGLVAPATLVAFGNVKRPRLLQLLSERGGSIHLAMDNCPHQIVVCGDSAELQEVVRELGSGAIAQPLPFARPYHTPLFAPVVDRLRDFYERLPLAAPRRPLWSSTTAAPVPADPDALRQVTREQWMRPVRFRETVERMYEAGIRVFVEIGPGGHLASFVRDTLGRRAHLAVPTDRTGQGMGQLHRALGQLVAHGVPLDLEALYSARTIDPLPTGTVWNRRARRRSIRSPLALSLPKLTLGEAALTRPTRPTRDPGAHTGAAATDRTRAGIAAYARTMAQFLSLQEATFTAALGRAQPSVAANAAPAAAAPRPIRQAARRTSSFDVERDGWLRDHALGPVISRDPSLAPLAVLPLAVAVELMAAAAADCCGGSDPIAIENVRLTRWIAADGGRIDVEARAHRTGAAAAEAQLSCSEAGADSVIAARATIRTEGGGPAERRTLASLNSPRPWPWPQDTLYEQGRRRGMFHGPSLQGVVAIDRIGDDGADATLRTDLPLAPGLATGASSVAPGLLDAAGQVVGFWAAACLTQGFVIFPNGFDRLWVHRAPADMPPRVRCRARLREVRPGDLVADLEVAAEEGEPLLSIDGWTTTRHDLPEDLYAYCIDPAHSSLGRPWPAALNGSPQASALSCCRVQLPPATLEAHGGIWERVLAHIALGRDERERWRGLPANGRRQEWLLGRIAAKDAVRALHHRREDSVLYPADVQVANDGTGAPHAAISSEGPVAEVPVSITHTAGVAAAVAAEPGTVGGVGIDIEPEDRATDRLVRAAFDADERAAIESAAGAEPAGVLRAWCAKEAAAKALGAGMVHGPHALRVLALDPTSGELHLTPSGGLLAARPWLRNARLTVYTAMDGGFVSATAVADGNGARP